MYRLGHPVSSFLSRLTLRSPLQDTLTHHMPSTQHLLSHVHELGNTVSTISDVLLELARDKGDCFGAVKDETSSETSLGELAETGEDELVLLPRQEMHGRVRIAAPELFCQC